MRTAWRWLRRMVIGVLAIVLVSIAWSRLRSGAKAMRIREIPVHEEIIEDGRPGFNVGCYNIAHGRGGTVGASNRRPDGKDGLLKHLREIGRAIRSEKLDIVVLNEVDFSSSWSWRVNQAEVIAAEAGLPYIVEQCSYDLSLCFHQWRFGNAVLSRFPIRDAESIGYPAFKPFENIVIGTKDGGSCLVDSPLGALRVVAVHLDVRDQGTREASMRVLSDYEERHPSQPLLILGDFNAQAVFEGSDRMRSTGGFDATFPSSAPERRIDWIFSRGLELGRDKVFGDGLSDHLGLKARVISFQP